MKRKYQERRDEKMAAIEGLTSQDFLVQKALEEKQKSAKNSTELTITDFYKLMAAQLQYQDMNNPADTSEMMATMIQSQMIQAITNMSQTNTISYAASMVGKEATMAEVDVDGKYSGDTKGVISGVVLGDNPLIIMNGKSYHLSQIVALGNVETKSETNNDEANKGESNSGGENNNDKVE